MAGVRWGQAITFAAADTWAAWLQSADDPVINRRWVARPLPQHSLFGGLPRRRPADALTADLKRATLARIASLPAYVDTGVLGYSINHAFTLTSGFRYGLTSDWRGLGYCGAADLVRESLPLMLSADVLADLSGIVYPDPVAMLISPGDSYPGQGLITDEPPTHPEALLAVQPHSRQQVSSTASTTARDYGAWEILLDADGDRHWCNILRDDNYVYNRPAFQGTAMGGYIPATGQVVQTLTHPSEHLSVTTGNSWSSSGTLAWGLPTAQMRLMIAGFRNTNSGQVPTYKLYRRLLRTGAYVWDETEAKSGSLTLDGYDGIQWYYWYLDDTYTEGTVDLSGYCGFEYELRTYFYNGTETTAPSKWVIGPMPCTCLPYALPSRRDTASPYIPGAWIAHTA